MNTFKLEIRYGFNRLNNKALGNFPTRKVVLKKLNIFTTSPGTFGNGIARWDVREREN